MYLVPDDHNNAVAIAGSLVSNEELLGDSSIGALLTSFQPAPSASPTSSSVTLDGKHPPQLHFAASDLELPARDLADHLVANYARFVHVIFPILYVLLTTTRKSCAETCR